MDGIYVKVTAVMDASAESVYQILADYRIGHPAILPKPYFFDLTVEQGGRGAGTVVVTRMKAIGPERSFRMVVSEPQPGRVLVENDAVTGTTTTFTVEPLAAAQCRITIATDTRISPGLQGWIERMMSPPFLRRIYRLELQNLAEYARRKG